MDITEGLSYTAHEETPNGQEFFDSGTATVEVAGAEASEPLPALSTFIEAFESGPLPTTREECQNGGFENFDFENQGCALASWRPGASANRVRTRGRERPLPTGPGPM